MKPQRWQTNFIKQVLSVGVLCVAVISSSSSQAFSFWDVPATFTGTPYGAPWRNTPWSAWQTMPMQTMPMSSPWSWGSAGGSQWNLLPGEGGSTSTGAGTNNTSSNNYNNWQNWQAMMAWLNWQTWQQRKREESDRMLALFLMESMQNPYAVGGLTQGVLPNYPGSIPLTSAQPMHPLPSTQAQSSANRPPLSLPAPVAPMIQPQKIPDDGFPPSPYLGQQWLGQPPVGVDTQPSAEPMPDGKSWVFPDGSRTPFNH